MTTTYDPFHPKYFDEADLREEMDRVYDLCHGCRLCFKFCPSFPTLFDAHRPARRPGQRPAHRRRAGPGRRRVLQLQALLRDQLPVHPRPARVGTRLPPADAAGRQVCQQSAGEKTAKQRVTDKALVEHRPGRVAQLRAARAGRQQGHRRPRVRHSQGPVEGGRHRRGAAPAAVRQHPLLHLVQAPHAHAPWASAKRAVAVFPTCLVEYQDTQVGKDLVEVYERNGVSCSLPEGMRCCGAPALHQGDLDRSARTRRTTSRCSPSAIRGPSPR